MFELIMLERIRRAANQASREINGRGQPAEPGVERKLLSRSDLQSQVQHETATNYSKNVNQQISGQLMPDGIDTVSTGPVTNNETTLIPTAGSPLTVDH